MSQHDAARRESQGSSACPYDDGSDLPDDFGADDVRAIRAWRVTLAGGVIAGVLTLGLLFWGIFS